MSLGTPEILVCLVVALLVLGPDKLPAAARQVGRAIAEFRKFSAGMQAQVNNMINIDDEKDKKEPVPYTPPPTRSTDGFRLIDEEAAVTQTSSVYNSSDPQDIDLPSTTASDLDVPVQPPATEWSQDSNDAERRDNQS